MTAAVIAAMMLAGAEAPAAARTDNIDKLKREKQDVRREINATRKKIDVNKKETSRQLSRLDNLRQDIARQNAIIGDARHKVDSVTTAMKSVNDSIARLEQSLASLRKSYAAALRSMQGTTTLSGRWAFIFSAPSVTDMWRRMRYMRQYSAWSARRADDIRRVRQSLDTSRQRLAALGRERSDQLARADLAGRRLETQRAETSSLVASLKKEQSSLRAYLQEKEAQKRRLDASIDRLIAKEAEARRKAEQERKRKEAERRKREEAARKSNQQTTQTPAPQRQQPQEREADPDRALTGSFESNRGRLLFPVAGKYRISRPFGRQAHPDLPNVVTDNSGIDIEVDKGAQARAVFEGSVSAIFRQDGYSMVVMVRHGSYITIYAGLGALSVKTGDKVRTGQALGTVRTDTEDDGKTTLHFEIRHEREKLNPSRWVR